MLTKGQDYCAKITDSTILGSGVVKIDGCAVFVNGTVTGDVCHFEITNAKKNFAEAKLLAITDPSPYRTSTDCQFSDRCGGCALRHVNIDYESDIKRNTIISALRKTGLPYDTVKKTLTANTRRYRNNVQLHFAPDGAFGFYEEESSTVCPLSSGECDVIPEIFYEIGKFTSEYTAGTSLPYPERLALRQSKSGSICAALTYKDTVPELLSFAEKLMNSFPTVTGVVSKSSDESHYRTVKGDRYLETNLMGLELRVSPEAFFQVNYEGAELLFSKVIEYASRCDFTYCADLYCGTGVIGMILASRFADARFTGVEINAEAVEDAKANAKLNGIENINFYCGDAGKFASENAPELVVVDPPRRGLSDNMIKVIEKLSPDNVIYVSCNPFTLARDLKKLITFGYKIYEATPVNMFPRAGHVETVVLLSKN